MTKMVRIGALTLLVAGVGYVDQPAAFSVAGSSAAPSIALAAAAAARDVTVPSGTRLRVRLRNTVASDANRVEDPVEGTLTDAVTVNGRVIFPAGSVVRGVVSEAAPSGKVKGRAVLGVRFQTVTVRGGDRYDIRAGFTEEAKGTTGEDAKKIGLPALGGAVVGAILGGGKGAAAGAAIGGGAGTAVVLSTPGDEVRLHSGTVLVLRLQRSVRVDTR